MIRPPSSSFLFLSRQSTIFLGGLAEGCWTTSYSLTSSHQVSQDRCLHSRERHMHTLHVMMALWYLQARRSSRLRPMRQRHWGFKLHWALWATDKWNPNTLCCVRLPPTQRQARPHTAGSSRKPTPTQSPEHIPVIKIARIADDSHLTAPAHGRPDVKEFSSHALVNIGMTWLWHGLSTDLSTVSSILCRLC